MNPALGRLFGAQEEKPGLAPQVVVSYRFWENHLESDPSIVGKTIQINGNACMVIGVGPRDFLGASPALYLADLWIPVTVGSKLAPELGNHVLERRDLSLFHVVGILNTGVTGERAEAELDSVARQLEQDRGATRNPDASRRLNPGCRRQASPAPQAGLAVLHIILPDHGRVGNADRVRQRR